MGILKATVAILLLSSIFAVGRLSVASGSGDSLLRSDIPTYPAIARTANIQGKVEIQVTTDTEGNVVSAQATSGSPLLTNAALENVKAWRFKGPSERTISYEFKIEQRAANTIDDFYKYGRIVFNPPNSVQVIFPPMIVMSDRSVPIER
jgi:TonB family protein